MQGMSTVHQGLIAGLSLSKVATTAADRDEADKRNRAGKWERRNLQGRRRGAEGTAPDYSLERVKKKKRGGGEHSTKGWRNPKSRGSRNKRREYLTKEEDLRSHLLSKKERRDAGEQSCGNGREQCPIRFYRADDPTRQGELFTAVR